MKITRAVAILLALFLYLTAMEPSAYPLSPNRKYTMQEKAADFSLEDLQGRKFKLSENKGKPVLLVFGATWCPSCREEIPHLKKIFTNYGKKGLVMVNIDVQESHDKVSRFAERYKLPYPVLLDEKAEVARSYGVRGIPTLVLVDKEGMILCSQCGSIERYLDKMLQKK